MQQKSGIGRGGKSKLGQDLAGERLPPGPSLSGGPSGAKDGPVDAELLPDLLMRGEPRGRD